MRAFQASKAVVASIAATSRRVRPRASIRASASQSGTGLDEAVARDRDGAGDAAEPLEDAGELDRVGRVGRPHALQRLGVGRAVLRTPSTQTSQTVTTSASMA